MNRSTVALALGLAFASLGLGPAAHAQDARLTSRIAPITFQFLALQRFDLSRFNTASRNQWPTGDCVGFSHMAAIEARFNHKYCESGALNAFRLDGYCARFDAYSRTPFFVFGAYANTWSDNYLASLKELDLSEQYYIHRVFTQSTASAGSARDTLSSYNFGDRSIPDTNVLMATQSLSEERHAPFINDASFYGATGVAASINTYLSPTNFAQSKVDQSEFAETLFPSILPGSMVQRVSIPLAARTNARFKVLDIYHGKLAAVGDAYYRTQFIERAIYGGYEIALHGCQPGHSMLLVGFDRVQKLFYFKDHYRRWVTVPYATALNADSYTVVLDVDYEATPAKEEMWLGVWEVDLDGRVGQLTLRRTRQPTRSPSRRSSVRRGTARRCCATARTRTRAPRCTSGPAAATRSRRRSSCTARRCPTTTTSTPTPRCGRRTTSTSPASRSSSTPTRAASRSAATSPTRTPRRTRATRCRRSAASSPRTGR